MRTSPGPGLGGSTSITREVALPVISRSFTIIHHKGIDGKPKKRFKAFTTEKTEFERVRREKSKGFSLCLCGKSIASALDPAQDEALDEIALRKEEDQYRWRQRHARSRHHQREIRAVFGDE